MFYVGVGVKIEEIQNDAPIKATHYDNEYNFYYADGWFLYKWNGWDWDIVDMYPDVSKLNPIWSKE